MSLLTSQQGNEIGMGQDEGYNNSITVLVYSGTDAIVNPSERGFYVVYAPS